MLTEIEPLVIGGSVTKEVEEKEEFPSSIDQIPLDKPINLDTLGAAIDEREVIEEGPEEETSPEPDEQSNEEHLLLEDISDDPTGAYLREIGKITLLDDDQVIDLAKKKDAGLLTEENLRKNGYSEEKISQNPVVQAGKDARDTLVSSNTRLVVSVAKRYLGLGVPFLDLLQEGNIGLIKAVERFDHHRGYKLSTYATWWIRQAVTRALSNNKRIIGLSVHKEHLLGRIFLTARKIEQELGTAPTLEEIAEAMDLDPRKIRELIVLTLHPLSLEKPVGEEEDEELGSFVKDEGAFEPEKEAVQNSLHEGLNELLDTLTAREARILRLRYGLPNGRSYTLEEVGRKFDISRERVRQIQKGALRKLRHPRRSRRLKGYAPQQERSFSLSLDINRKW